MPCGERRAGINWLAVSDLNPYSPAMSVKQLALNAINHLPEDADLAAVQEEVALLAALEEAEADVKAGRLIPHAEVAKNLQQWLTN